MSQDQQASITLARLYDGFDPALGRPYFDPGHARIEDQAERERVAATC